MREKIAGALLSGAVCLFMSAAWVDSAQAEYIANIDQVGSDVVVTGSGTLEADLHTNRQLFLRNCAELRRPRGRITG